MQLKLISFNLGYDSHLAFNSGLRARNMKDLSVIPEFASLLNEFWRTLGVIEQSSVRCDSCNIMDLRISDIPELQYSKLMLP